MELRDSLQETLDSLTGENSIYGVWNLEFRGKDGWWVVPDEKRHNLDKGEHLGQIHQEIVLAIKRLFPSIDSLSL